MSHSPISPDALKAATFCPICGRTFRPKHVTVLVEDARMRWIHSVCPRGNHGVLSLVYEGEDGLGCVGMTTELSIEDFRGLSSRRVQENDVLDVHKALGALDWREKLGLSNRGAAAARRTRRSRVDKGTTTRHNAPIL